ncbi:MAG: LytTR family DNA-binding domain-containing protein [Chitinophagaceae bacterium]
MIRVVIIEDERLIAAELQSMLSDLPDEIIVSAILGSVTEAKEYLTGNDGCDLIFSDIQLPDGLSFGIFDSLACNIPVIFITAFDRYVVNGFEHNGIDYLLKPVDEKELQKVVNKYKMLDQHFAKRQKFINAFAKERKRLIVKRGNVSISLRLDDVVLFYTENKIVYVIDRDGKKYLCDKNLGELEVELNESRFFRVNRQYIVNAEYIHGYKAHDKVRIQIDLISPVTDQLIIVSQETAPLFRRWMNEI